MLEAGEHSLELCGGTHVTRLGDIGSLKVVSEGSIGSNLRRVEAVTGLATLELLRTAEATLSEAARALGSQPGQLIETIKRRTEENRTLGAEVAGLQDQLAELRADGLIHEAVARVLVTRIDGLDPQSMKSTALLARQQGSLRAVIVGGVGATGRPAVVVSVDPGSGLDASDVMTPIAKAIQGGFGRHREIVLAGGRDVTALDEALKSAEAVLTQL